MDIGDGIALDGGLSTGSAVGAAYDAIAVDFADDERQIPFEVLWHMNRFAERLQPNSSVLDAGCGAGRDMLQLTRLGMNVVGIDISQAMLDQARAKGVPVDRLKKLDMLDIDQLGTGVFDAAWANASLVHLPKGEQEQALRAIRTSLKPGGTLGMTLRLSGSEQSRDGWVESRGVSRWFTHNDMNRIESTLRKTGFVSDEITRNVTGDRRFFYVRAVAS